MSFSLNLYRVWVVTVSKVWIHSERGAASERQGDVPDPPYRPKAGNGRRF